MAVSIEIKHTKETRKQLNDLAGRIEDAANLEKSVFILESNIVARAPVDTGRYRLAWETVKLSRFSYEIRNDVEYAKYLIFGRVGRGIQHDVRGIVRYWRNWIARDVLTKIGKG